MDEPNLTLRLRLWLEADDGMVIGMGRALLLAKVAELGSLNKAAKDLGMSYRAAWGRMKETERHLAQPLLEKSGPRSGYELTELGRSLAKDFAAFQQEVEAYALQCARKRFSFTVQPFDEALSQFASIQADGEDTGPDDA